MFFPRLRQAVSIGHLRNSCKPQFLSLLNATIGREIASHLIFYHGFYRWPNSRLYFEFSDNSKAKYWHGQSMCVPIFRFLSRYPVTKQIKGLKRYFIWPLEYVLLVITEIIDCLQCIICTKYK